jgi:DNA-binding MarR family transcriptional regulator
MVRTTLSPIEPRLFLREEELDRAVDLVLSAARVFFQAAAPALSDHGLGPAHYRALAAVRREGEMTVSALIARLGVRKQSLARVLNEVEAAGLIRRRPDPSDRRARLLSLTPAGEEAERAASKALRDRLGQVFRAAGPEAVAGAHAVLTGLTALDEEAP